VSTIDQTSPAPILSEGSLLSIDLRRSISSFEYFKASGGNLTVPLIWASFSKGLKGDLKNIKVYIMHPSAQMSTFSVIGKPENKSSYSGERYKGVVVFSISSAIRSLD
jgi:hypothetical protein